MAKVTYRDLDRSAPYVEFHGVEFTHGLPVEVDDGRVEMLEILARNDWFTVENWKHNGKEEISDPEDSSKLKAERAAIDREKAEFLAKVRRKGVEAYH